MTWFSKALRFFFDHTLGPWAAGAIGLVCLWGAWGLSTNSAYNRGGKDAKAEVSRKARKLGDDAVQARRAADVPGAAERLRQRYCRDC